MAKSTSVSKRFTSIAKGLISLVFICAFLSSCAPINNRPSLTASKTLGKSQANGNKSYFVSRARIIKAEAAPTIFGFKVPAALSFSHLTRFLSTKDESLDKSTVSIPEFPTVADVQSVEESTDSFAIEDERSLLLLSEAQALGDFSENKTLSEIARGSLARTMELVSKTEKPNSSKLSHSVMVVLALCISVLVTCGYFVVSYFIDELRVRSSPRFGAMQ